MELAESRPASDVAQRRLFARVLVQESDRSLDTAVVAGAHGRTMQPEGRRNDPDLAPSGGPEGPRAEGRVGPLRTTHYELRTRPDDPTTVASRQSASSSRCGCHADPPR